MWIIPVIVILFGIMVIISKYLKERPKKRKIKAWLARTRWDALWLYYYKKPYKDELGWWPAKDSGNLMSEIDDNQNQFPEVQSYDEEPTEIEIIIKPIKKKRTDI